MPNPILDKLIYNGLVEYKPATDEWVVSDVALKKNAGDLVRAEEWVRVLYTLAVQGNINTNVMQTITNRFNNFEELKDPALLENIRDVIAKVNNIDGALVLEDATQAALSTIGVDI